MTAFSNPKDTFVLYMDLPDETTMEWPCTGRHQLKILIAQVRLVALQLRGVMRVIDGNGEEVPT